MKYLMTYDNGKKPLRYTRINNGFAISAGSLGTVFPALVDPNETYATHLRFKVNNQVKAFATMPSVIFPCTLCRKTGDTIELPTGITGDATLRWNQVFYDEYDGMFIGYSKIKNYGLIHSSNGERWEGDGSSAPYNGWVCGAHSTPLGAIVFTVSQENYNPSSGFADYYLNVYLYRLSGVQLLCKKLIYNWNNDDAIQSRFRLKFAHKPEPISNNTYTTVIAVTFPSQYDPMADYTEADCIRIKQNNQGQISGEFILLARKELQEGVIKDTSYNNLVGAYECDGLTGGSYDGINWSSSINVPVAYGKVGNYEILNVNYQNFTCTVSNDGQQITKNVSKVVQGFDPVDNTYISMSLRREYTGEASHYNVYCDIYSSSNLDSWRLLKTIDYGETRYWNNDIPYVSALDIYSALGFTNN